MDRRRKDGTEGGLESCARVPMIHEEGAPVWVRVGRTDHHALVVSAVVGGDSGTEPARYGVRWSNGTVQEVDASDVRPDEGGRSRTRRPPAAIYQETNRQMKCADGSGGRKKAGPRGAGAGPREEKDDDIPPRYAVGQEIKKVSMVKAGVSCLFWQSLISRPIDYATALSRPRNFQREYHRLVGGVLPRQVRG